MSHSREDKIENAERLFDDFYDYCLENGIEPEQIVKNVGEMLLLTNQEDIDRFENA